MIHLIIMFQWENTNSMAFLLKKTCISILINLICRSNGIILYFHSNSSYLGDELKGKLSKISSIVDSLE